MCVKVAGKMSSLKNVTSGVPQGSVLGPVLLLIYVNHIANSVECCCKAFADDFKLYFSFPPKTYVPILQGMIRLQKDLDKVCSVARFWNLRLNINKCVVMRFGAYNADNRVDCNYSIDDKLLEFVTSH